MPKAKGDPYFVSARAGAEDAARELGVDLIWDGPTALEAAKQNELVENWITRRVDAIAVAVENKAGLSTVLRKARERGIPHIDVGRGCGAGCSRVFRQSGHIGSDRQYSNGRSRPVA
jgi:ABC-type sugar transport system substrate-binding protein